MNLTTLGTFNRHLAVLPVTKEHLKTLLPQKNHTKIHQQPKFYFKYRILQYTWLKNNSLLNFRRARAMQRGCGRSCLLNYVSLWRWEFSSVFQNSAQISKPSVYMLQWVWTLKTLCWWNKQPQRTHKVPLAVFYTPDPTSNVGLTNPYFYSSSHFSLLETMW
jgi:hypothetical protein